MFQFWLAPVYFSFLFFLGSCAPQLEDRAQKWRTQAKTPFGATPTVPQRLPQALVALVRLPNYLMASCSLLRFVRLTSAQVATWISAAPVAPCLFICQRLPLCHAPLQRKSLHGPPQRQSLHVDSIHCQRLPLMLHFTRCSASQSLHTYASCDYASALSLHERCPHMIVVAT